VLFGALLAAYLAVRAKQVIPMPALPWAFWISTGAVLISSLILEYSFRSSKLGHHLAAYRALLGATALNYMFFAVQAAGIVMLLQLSLPFRGTSQPLYIITLALLGLHLLHATGALVGLSLASLRSEKHHFTADNIGQIRPLKIYCHFLAGIWMVIFCVLIFANL